MNDKDFSKLVAFKNVGSGLVPENDLAIELLEMSKKNQIHYFLPKTNRDIKFHRAYMLFVGNIWEYLPSQFKKQIPKHHFYNWLKMFNGDYDEIFSFKNENKVLIEFHSIAFGRMNEEAFKDFVRMQIPKMYEVIYLLFEPNMAADIIETIEEDFMKFLSKV